MSELLNDQLQKASAAGNENEVDRLLDRGRTFMLKTTTRFAGWRPQLETKRASLRCSTAWIGRDG